MKIRRCFIKKLLIFTSFFYCFQKILKFLLYVKNLWRIRMWWKKILTTVISCDPDFLFRFYDFVKDLRNTPFRTRKWFELLYSHDTTLLNLDSLKEKRLPTPSSRSLFCSVWRKAHTISHLQTETTKINNMTTLLKLVLLLGSRKDRHQRREIVLP